MDNELSPSSSKEDGVYRIPKKQFYGLVITLISTLIGTIGTVGVAYYDRPDTVDRWYGYQGRANRADINELIGEVKQLKSDLEELRSTKISVIGRVSSLEGVSKQRHEEFHNHVEWGRQMVREFSVNDARTAVRLDECLKRTGLK